MGANIAVALLDIRKLLVADRVPGVGFKGEKVSSQAERKIREKPFFFNVEERASNVYT